MHELLHVHVLKVHQVNQDQFQLDQFKLPLRLTLTVPKIRSMSSDKSFDALKLGKTPPSTCLAILMVANQSLLAGAPGGAGLLHLPPRPMPNIASISLLSD